MCSQWGTCATAKANGRDVIEPRDLSITKGLQERMHEFLKMEEDLEVAQLLEQLLTRPPLGVATTLSRHHGTTVLTDHVNLTWMCASRGRDHS